MALQHLRSSTANKRPTPAAMSDGQLAMNTNTASPGLFFKDSNGDSIKAGPAHVGTTAPNATPGAGGQAGNSKGELWLDTTGGTYVLKAWDGTAWRSVSLTGDFVETTGDTMTGALVMDDQGQVRFRETTANGTSYVALQAAASVASNKTITLPDATGTVVLSGAIVNADINTSAAIALSKLATGALPTAITVASANIVNGTIANADINASAAIADTKLATISTAGKVSNSATTATNANTASAIVARDASGNFTAGTITANLTGTASNVTTNANLTGDVTSVGNATAIAAGVIVNADINASAAIALSKLATGALPAGITVASTNIADGTIVNADINASAAIVDTKLATIATAGKVSNSATTATDANTASAIVARSAAGNFNITSINNGPLAGMRNAIINGNFDHWQRGTSQTTAGHDSTDRWRLNVASTINFSRQAFTFGQTSVPGNPDYFARYQVTAAPVSTNNNNLQQRIEGVSTFAGEQVSVSFWAKADAAKSIWVGHFQYFGTGGSPSAVSNTSGQVFTLSTSWARYSLTTTLPSVSGKTLGSNGDDYLSVHFIISNASAGEAWSAIPAQTITFDIAQVQLEPGPVATPFERRPIGTELSLCQRYFNKSYAVGTNPGTATTSGQLAGSFAAAGSGSMHSIVRYPVVMRSTATVTVYNPVTGNANSARRGSSNVVPTQGSGADSGVIVIISGSSADNYAHHYTADSEL